MPAQLLAACSLDRETLRLQQAHHLVGVIALTAGLMIFPALTLGPIVEGLMP